MLDKDTLHMTRSYMLSFSRLSNKGIIYFTKSSSFIMTTKPCFSTQKKLIPGYAKWVKFLLQHTFVITHKARQENVVANALRRVKNLLCVLSTKITTFDHLKDNYARCPDFGPCYAQALDFDLTNTPYRLHNGYLLLGNLLCAPRTSLQDHLLKELHAGGAARHHRHDKTLALAKEHSYWPSL